MCMTHVRVSDVRRDKRAESDSDEDARKRPIKRTRLDETSSESSDADSNVCEKETGRHSLKASYLAKVLGPVIGYGADYELFQFTYDLHMWTMLGAKRNLRGGDVPLRILMKGANFTPGYWRVRHLALIDMQRQLGLPQLFFTLSPYEWSMPYHKVDS